jgi:hypothetical protein
MKIQEVDMYNVHVRRSCATTVLTTLAAFACLLIALVPAQVVAQAKVGTTGAQFLELGVSARAMGMGEAFVAVVNDVSAVYYNPAALTTLLGSEAMGTYIDMPADVQYGFAAYGRPVESVGGVVGVGLYYLTSGSMPERTYENAVNDANGISGTGREFAWNDLAVSVGYGRYLTDRFAVGFTVRYINESVHEYSANGWSADVGCDYNTGYRGFRMSMAITNFGPDMKFIQKEYPLPINFRFGGAINIIEHADHTLTLAAEGSHPSDNLEKYNTGLEYTFKEMFSLRAGSRFNYDSDGLTFGGGLRIPYGEDMEFRMDYAYQDFGILTEVHRFTMSVAF